MDERHTSAEDLIEKVPEKSVSESVPSDDLSKLDENGTNVELNFEKSEAVLESGSSDLNCPENLIEGASETSKSNIEVPIGALPLKSEVVVENSDGSQTVKTDSAGPFETDHALSPQIENVEKMDDIKKSHDDDEKMEVDNDELESVNTESENCEPNKSEPIKSENLDEKKSERPVTPPRPIVPSEDEPVIYNLCSLRKDGYRQMRVISQVLAHMILDPENSSTKTYRDQLKERGILDDNERPINWDPIRHMLPFKFASPTVPHQVTDYDCGVFSVYFIQHWYDEGRPKMNAPKEELEGKIN